MVCLMVVKRVVSMAVLMVDSTGILTDAWKDIEKGDSMAVLMVVLKVVSMVGSMVATTDLSYVGDENYIHIKFLQETIYRTWKWKRYIRDVKRSIDL